MKPSSCALDGAKIYYVKVKEFILFFDKKCLEKIYLRKTVATTFWLLGHLGVKQREEFGGLNSLGALGVMF